MESIVRKMKTNTRDEMNKQSCATCEFNCGLVCGGYGTRTDNGEKTYGMLIDKAEEMFPQGCEDYGISLNAFVEQERMNGR